MTNKGTVGNVVLSGELHTALFESLKISKVITVRGLWDQKSLQQEMGRCSVIRITF